MCIRDRICFHTSKDLLQKRNITNFFFRYYGKRDRTGIYDCQHIVEPLMIREKHKSVFLWNILNAMCLNVDAVSYTHLDVYKRQELSGLIL